jgi:hypothetical protein
VGHRGPIAGRKSGKGEKTIVSNSSKELKGSNAAGSLRLHGDAVEMNGRSIGLKLGLAFDILVVILVGIGILGISRMDRINADLQEVLGRRWAKLRLSREALRYSNQNSRITMQIFFTG